MWGSRAQCPIKCPERSEVVRGYLSLRQSHTGMGHQSSGFWNTGEKTALSLFFLEILSERTWTLCGVAKGDSEFDISNNG